MSVKKTTTSKKYLRIFLSMLALAIVIGMFFLWRYLQKPSSGKIKTNTSVATVPVSDSLERFEGKYFSFAHDSKYTLKSHEEDLKKTGVILESAFFTQSDINSKKIAITVEDIQGRTMGDTGSFIMRKKNSKVYTEEQFEINAIKGISFSAMENGFLERVFFIPREGYVAEVAFTGPIAEDGTFNAEMTAILKSIQWKK